MKKLILVTVLVLLPALLSCSLLNQGLNQIADTEIDLSGKIVSENRPVRGFTKVQLDGLGDLTILIGDTESLVVEADENLQPRIITEVKGDTLIIRMDETNVVLVPTIKINYSLTAKSLESVDLNGLGNITIEPLQTDDMSLQLDGSGAITLESLTATNLIAEMSGLGGLIIKSGKVSDQVATLSGAGAYQAGDLESETATVSVTGLGGATVWVTGTLNAELTGAGSLEYYGKPQVTADDTGLGSIKSLGEK